MKIRQNNRQQWSIWYILALIAIGFVILKLIQTNTNLFYSEDENKVCDTCPSENPHEAGQFVPVPISEVMSGKPIILPQDDKRIINYIWSNQHIQPPSQEPYNLEHADIDPSRGQAQFIRRILKNMTNGYFVECGALDGETRSNTLFMEMNLGWKGLLVEGDPINFAVLQTKNRKAWMANTCLSVKPYPHTANFLQKFNTGKILGAEEAADFKDSKHVTVQCMPLFSLLTALNVSTVDYFSLDVEGSELKVLSTIPFDKVHIRTLSVEYLHTKEGKRETIEFMKSHNYRMVGEVHYPNNWANDLIFVHEDVVFSTD